MRTSEAGTAALDKLRALCIEKGLSDEDADEFVACTRTLGRAEAMGEGTLAEITEAGMRALALIEKYPEIQR